MKPLLFIALALSAAISTLPTAAEQSDRSRPERRLNISTVTYEAERQEVKRILADNFAALRRGKKSLAYLAEKSLNLSEEAASDIRRRILLDGAVRIFTRIGDTKRAQEAKMRLKAILHPFAVSGDEAVLHLGKYGNITFAHCPTGTLDLVTDRMTAKTIPVTLTKPYWIMKFPLTRRESSLYPPLDPPPGTVTEDGFASYVCLNRSQAEGLCEYFTQRFRDALPDGYEVRLPTLAEWEYAYHARTQDGRSPFFDLRYIHINDDTSHAVQYDYDRHQPRRRKLVNDWGIGDWCGQEKVWDSLNPATVKVHENDSPDFHTINALPPLASLTDPYFDYQEDDRLTLIRMPFWARWKVARISYNRDWCPIRLVIAPAITRR